MSQVSGSIVFELPIERLARLVAAEIIEHIGRPDVLDAIGAAIARRIAVDQHVSTEPGGYPVGGRHRATGSYDYEREPRWGER